MSATAVITPLPEYPAVRRVVCDDAPLFRALFTASPKHSSVYSFANIFAWHTTDRTELCRLGEAVLVRDCPDDGGHEYLEPLHTPDPVAAMRAVAAAEPGCRFKFVTAPVAAALAGDPAFTVTRDPDNDDYVYRTRDLIDLPGRKYDGKRNHLNRLRRTLVYDYVPLTPQTVPAFREYAARWCTVHGCPATPALLREHAAIGQLLANPCALGLRGGAIRVDGTFVAIALGEPLADDTFVVYIEKADTDIDGLYQLINREFAAQAAADYPWLNREQDLGIPGLRRAKQSYHPDHMVEVWQIIPAV